jgi:DNA mismatch endonuclease (patch repair protein)
MVDVHSKETRSFNMSRIKSQDTKPEIMIRQFLFANGFRFRLHDKTLPGKPDIVLKKYNTVIFVNGCYWHGHSNCKYFKLPATNTKFWSDKIDSNINNDEKNYNALKDSGYNLIVIWECQIKDKSIFKTLIQDVKKDS